MAEIPLPRSLSVCLVSAAYHPYPSGVSEHVAHLARALRDEGHHVAVLTTRHGPSALSEPDPFPVTRLGRAVNVPLNGSYATLPLGLRLPAQVRRYLDAGHSDIIHCHGLFWPEISYWALRHSQAVNVVTFLSAGFGTPRRGAGAFRHLFRRHLGRIDGRIAISRRALEAFEAYVPGDCRIIPCGVDTLRFRTGLSPLPQPGTDKGPSLLYVGRLDRRKGLCTLLDALPAVRAMVPGCRLVVVGDGPERARSERRAAELGIAPIVDFQGRVSADDLPRFYAGADAYCSPALGGEALGIVLLEAMACGTPVVASDIPGYDETVRRDVDGLLCPPGDASALANALAGVLLDSALRQRLETAGRERAERYAWPSIARLTIAYYRELLAAARPGAGSARPSADRSNRTRG